MSDMMGHVLRMPFNLAMQTDLSRRQYWDRAQEAMDEIERLRAIKAAAQAIIDYSDAGPDHDGDWLHWDEKFEALREVLK